MSLSPYPIPSATKTVTITETELLALQYPFHNAERRNVWRDLPGEEIRQAARLPEGYFITNRGRLMHEKTCKSGRIIRTEVKGTGNPEAAVSVVIYAPTRISVRFPRVMLETFKPNSRSKFLEAVPMDGNPRNLLLENWSWMTRTEAREYRKQYGEEKIKLHTEVVKGRYGEYTKKVKFSKLELSEMKRLINASISLKKIAEIFDCNVTYVSYIRNKMAKSDETTS